MNEGEENRSAEKRCLRFVQQFDEGRMIFRQPASSDEWNLEVISTLRAGHVTGCFCVIYLSYDQVC